ncbi:MAG: hypothetical protein NQU41_02730 [Candidatus Methanosuratincola sp.]|nr:hypothetical protein [Candidatus Methanosuratincola sp.]
MGNLKAIVDEYMSMARGIDEMCTRCLRTERWGGSVTLMVVDAAFTSIGLNYFTAVVPKVDYFRREFVEAGRIKTLKDLAESGTDELLEVWRNRRSWEAARGIASYLSALPYGTDREALRSWARSSSLVNWRLDPVGRIRGVGLVTYQYLRMMGGVDTVMPDKIVKRVINEMLVKAGEEPVEDNLAFILKAEEIAKRTGYRPIDLCWMTWMIQPEGKIMRMDKYSGLLHMI